VKEEEEDEEGKRNSTKGKQEHPPRSHDFRKGAKEGGKREKGGEKSKKGRGGGGRTKGALTSSQRKESSLRKGEAKGAKAKQARKSPQSGVQITLKEEHPPQVIDNSWCLLDAIDLMDARQTDATQMFTIANARLKQDAGLEAKAAKSRIHDPPASKLFATPGSLRVALDVAVRSVTTRDTSAVSPSLHGANQGCAGGMTGHSESSDGTSEQQVQQVQQQQPGPCWFCLHSLLAWDGAHSGRSGGVGLGFQRSYPALAIVPTNLRFNKILRVRIR
jgi:hypothetical protein